MLSLKPLSPSAVPAALAKAERYRLLNEPAQAESICEDVLAADPGNPQALVTLILAITDGFPSQGGQVVRRAQELASRLPGDYEAQYYAGLIAERRARALLGRDGPGRVGPAGAALERVRAPVPAASRAAGRGGEPHRAGDAGVGSASSKRRDWRPPRRATWLAACSCGLTSRIHPSRLTKPAAA